ncbi:MAG: hypothetical protein H0X33_02910 [Taibaiella sp.]|nr:hypothetical protein [Taibaiella sp.]
MGWIDRLFNNKEEEKKSAEDVVSTHVPSTAPLLFEGLEGIRFGRYTDHNKSYRQMQSWYAAEDLFKEKKYTESFKAFFDYLGDENENNIHFNADGDKFTFDILQGSRMVHGECDGSYVIAQVPLARMEHPGTAIMRCLLALNYTLYYSRTALDAKNVLYMIFDTDVVSANPNKMYAGLRELSIKADRQDDLLLADFATLQTIGNQHITPLPEHEVDIKYRYFRKWIEEVLAETDKLNQDSFSGAIAYMLLGTLYRIDFLMIPEAKLLADIEQIHAIYWEKKDELTLVERNQLMKDAMHKLLDITRDKFAAGIYRSTASFSMNVRAKTEKLRESINNANKDAAWYIDNKYPDIALRLNEYGVLYNHFISGMPRVLANLTLVYMAVMHADYFKDLGMKTPLYVTEIKEFDKSIIDEAVHKSIASYKDKYAGMNWDNTRTSYQSLYEFGTSFSEQMANLNLETKRER